MLSENCRLEQKTKQSKTTTKKLCDVVSGTIPILLPTVLWWALKTNCLTTTVPIKASRLTAVGGSKMSFWVPPKSHSQSIVTNWYAWQQLKKNLNHQAGLYMAALGSRTPNICSNFCVHPEMGNYLRRTWLRISAVLLNITSYSECKRIPCRKKTKTKLSSHLDMYKNYRI